MQVDLDDLGALRRFDPGDMLGRIAELPQQCRDAWALAQAFDLPAEYRAAKQVVIAGMGGSAIGGALVAGLVADEATVPISVVRDYRLPAFVGSETLVVGCSYSGNTEETLSAVREARERGARLLAITTDGQLAHIASMLKNEVSRISGKESPSTPTKYSMLNCVIQETF
jgi:glucose/mannose-6-phosphate isomerase